MPIKPYVFKTCSCCGQAKSVTANFTPSTHYRDKYQPECKDCRKLLGRAVKNKPHDPTITASHKVTATGSFGKTKARTSGPIQPIPSVYKTVWRHQ